LNCRPADPKSAAREIAAWPDVTRKSLSGSLHVITMDSNHVLWPSDFSNDTLLNSDTSAPEQVSNPVRCLLNGDNVKVLEFHGSPGPK